MGVSNKGYQNGMPYLLCSSDMFWDLSETFAKGFEKSCTKSY